MAAMPVTEAPEVGARSRPARSRRASPGSVEAVVPAVPQPPVRGRRNPKWIALGIVALCVGALGSFFLYNDLSKAQTVVAVDTTVYRGSVVKATDLVTVTVGSTPGIRTVPAGELTRLVGQRAVVDLMAGSLLPAEAIAPVAMPASKRALVGISLAGGRAPQGFLLPGSSVRLIALPPDGAEPTYDDQYSNLAIQARVVDAAPSPDGLSQLINVDVAADQAATVGTLAAQSRLVVVRDAER